MRFFTWTEAYSVHVEEIDAQHQWLTDIINTLYEEMSEKRGRRLLEIVIESLIQYVKLHFETEESLMRKYKYPQYEEHKTKHEILGQKVMEWNRQIVNNGVELTQDMLDFLKAWLENHEIKDDGPLGAYLNARGVK